MKDKLLRLIILFAGLVVAHLGVSLFLLADLGADPFNVMIQGLSRTIDIPLLTHGNTHMSVSILIIIILLFVGPVAGFFIPRSEKLVNYLLEEQN